MRKISFVLLITGLLAVCFGIGMEILTNEPVYLEVIAIGSCLIAVGAICYCFKGSRDG